MVVVLGCQVAGDSAPLNSAPLDSAPPDAPQLDSGSGSATSPKRLRGIEQVRTSRVEPGVVDALLTASGSITSPRTTDLGAEVGGRIQEVRVDVGDTLARGQVVFRIDPQPYEIDLLEARAGLELAEAEAAQALQEVKRLEKLVDQRIAPEQALEQQRTRYQVASARVAQEQAATQRAESNLERTTVRAPYDSYVVARHLHEGAWVGPGPTSVVVTLQQQRGYEAQVNVPESAAVPVLVGDPAELIIEGIDRPIEATVQAVNARIDPESRTYRVRIPIPRELEAVKAGAFVRAEIRPSKREQGLVLDRAGLLLRDGRTHAFRVERSPSDGKGATARLVDIRVGARGAGLVQVLDGLEVGDEVIVGPVIDRLADGSSVVVEPRPEAAREVSP